MRMKRIIKEIVLIFIVLISCSCAKDETIMTIGDTKYTKGDEYELLKISKN